MTATSDFDRVVAAWLQADGPSDVRADVVDASLAAAGRVGPRRGLAATVLGPRAWPAPRRRLALTGLPPVVRVALLVAATLAALTGLVVAGAQLVRQSSPPAYRGVFVPAADMAFGRTNAVVVPLVDGRVLIAGGRDSTGGRGDVPADVFDPATGKLTTIPLDAPHGKEGGSGVQLPDGRVFMIVRDGNTTSSGAWLVDPATMASRQVPPGGFSNAPVFGVSPSLALLSDGRVLIAGGLDDVYAGRLRSSALIFDPATETFTPTGRMSRPRWRHSMTTLPDGRVLVAGGEGTFNPYNDTEDMKPALLGDAEIYDPATGTFAPTGDMPRVRGATLAVPLPDGRVVVLPRWGSFSEYRNGWEPPVLDDPASEAPVDIFDPATGTFSAVGSTPGSASTATLLGTNDMLLTGHGGIDNGPWRRWGGRATWSVILHPVDGRVEPGPAPRALFPAATRLADGRVLLAGGWEPPMADGWPGTDVPWVDIFE
jgi:hypothetical protein